MLILDENVIILGRDGLIILKMKLYDQADVKGIISFHHRCSSQKVSPSDEEVIDCLKNIEHSKGGSPSSCMSNDATLK